MISGPVVSKTRHGLLDLVERRLDQVERGMSAVRFDLELEPGCTVDALAKDAAGRPVFVFACDPEEHDELPTRVLAARAWVSTGIGLLARAVPVAGLDYGAPPRFLALGFDVSHAALQQLLQLAPGSVEVFLLRPFRVGPQNVVGAMALIGDGAGEDENTFRAPSGVTDGELRSVCVQFLDLVRRLDPGVQVLGDRYSRQFDFGGQRLAEMDLVDGGLCVHVPVKDPEASPDAADGGDRDRLALASREDCADALDRVARRYLAVLDEERAVTTASPRRPRNGREQESAAAALSFDSLERSVEDSRQLSDQEYQILGHSLDDE